ncbi:MAG: LysR substrate-binding domain-containing protein [Candidatus Nanopelagicales bacterium]
MAARRWLGPPIGQLNRAHPGLRLKTVLAPWQELPDRARARDVDLIVLELSQVQQMDDFAVLAAERASAWWWCASREHPLTRLVAPTPADASSAIRWPAPASPPRRAAMLQVAAARQRVGRQPPGGEPAGGRM